MINCNSLKSFSEWRRIYIYLVGAVHRLFSLCFSKLLESRKKPLYPKCRMVDTTDWLAKSSFGTFFYGRVWKGKNHITLIQSFFFQGLAQCPALNKCSLNEGMNEPAYCQGNFFDAARRRVKFSLLMWVMPLQHLFRVPQGTFCLNKPKNLHRQETHVVTSDIKLVVSNPFCLRANSGKIQMFMIGI